jgi:hypothetical protein
LRVLFPKLNILDCQGNAPRAYLDLARTTLLLDRFEPLRRIFVDMLRDFMAFLLVTLKDAPVGDPDYPNYSNLECLLATTRYEPVCGPVVYTACGVAPLGAGVLHELGVRSLFLLRRSFSVNTKALLEGGSYGVLPIDLGDHDTTPLLYGGEEARDPPAGLNIGWSRRLSFEHVTEDI